MKPAERVKVVQVGGAHGIVAVERIQAGDLVVRIEGDRQSEPTRFSVQVGPGEHIEPPAEAGFDEYAWRFMNHSCEPNSTIQGQDVIALRTIEEGEEINFDYDTTEAEMAEPFQCGCGSTGCRGTIRGFNFLSEADQERLRPQLASHLRLVYGGIKEQ